MEKNLFKLSKSWYQNKYPLPQSFVFFRLINKNVLECFQLKVLTLFRIGKKARLPVFAL